MKKSTQQSKGPSNSGANTRAFTLNQFAIEVLRKDGVSVRDAQNLVRNLSPDEIKNLCEINGLYMSGPLEEEAATAGPSNSGANTRAFTLNQFAIEVLRKDGVSVRDAQNLVRNLSPDEIKNLCEINGLYMSGPLEEEAATAAASAPAPAAFVNASHPDDDHHLPEGQNPAVDVCGACVASPEAAHS